MRIIDKKLIEVCQYGDTLTVEQLLRRGANPNIQDQNTKTPTIIAAEYGHTPIITLLIQYGANPHIRDDWGKTALHYAIQNRHETTTEYLITQLKLDPNTPDRLGRTPFMIATEKGDIPMLQLLIQHGADPTTTDRQGRNILHYATVLNQYKTTEYLITSLQLDPNIQDIQGLTPVMIAARNGDIPMLRRLIQLGANPHLNDALGRNALYHAIEKHRHDVAQYLMIQLILHPNIQDSDGITPFMIAAQKGDISMLRLLIQFGANPTTTDHQGRNALHYAAERNRYETAHFLISHLDFDPNTQDHDGNTPLLIALQKGHYDTAQALIQLGAHPHIPNHQGQPPAAIARQHQVRLEKSKPSTITL